MGMYVSKYVFLSIIDSLNCCLVFFYRLVNYYVIKFTNIKNPKYLFKSEDLSKQTHTRH